MGWPAETAKAASNFADVCVIHDAKSGVAHLVVGVHALADGIGCLHHLGPRGVFQDVERFGRCQADAFNSFLQCFHIVQDNNFDAKAVFKIIL